MKAVGVLAFFFYAFVAVIAVLVAIALNTLIDLPTILVWISWLVFGGYAAIALIGGLIALAAAWADS